MEERDVIEISGALKGVEDTGCDEGERRSWVWRRPDREVEYAIEESVEWKMVDVKGVPCDGVNVAREDYIQLATTWPGRYLDRMRRVGPSLLLRRGGLSGFTIGRIN